MPNIVNPYLRRTMRYVLLLLSLVVSIVTGCDTPSTPVNWHTTCVASGLCDAEVAPAETFDVICDHSAASSCTLATLTMALDLVLNRAISRPGTHIRLWMLGVSMSSTTLLAEQVSPVIKAKGARARGVQLERWRKSAEELFLTAAKPNLASPPQRRTPLAEAMAKVQMADGYQLTRYMLIVSDLRELSSIADFKCGKLPSALAFTNRLHKHHLLSPGALQGTRVLVSHATPSAIPNCPSNIERELAIRSLWTAAWKAAGAQEVVIETGALRLALSPQPHHPGVDA